MPFPVKVVCFNGLLLSVVGAGNVPGVAEGDGCALGVALGDALGDAEGLGVAEGEGCALGVALGVALGDAEGLGVAAGVGVTPGVGCATRVTGAVTGRVAIVTSDEIPTFFTGFAGALFSFFSGSGVELEFSVHCAVHVRLAAPIVIGAFAPYVTPLHDHPAKVYPFRLNPPEPAVVKL